jgi:hypothetical protein
LYWIYRGKDPDDQFFIRLLAETGQPMIEILTTPRPDQHLVSGQLLIEDSILALPASLSSGFYSLQIGFYTPAVEAGELIFALPAELTRVTIVRKAGVIPFPLK